jgi:hypothetical protein
MIEVRYPRTRYEDYASYREAVNINLESFMRAGESREVIDGCMDRLHKHYEKRVFDEDYYSFTDLNNLELFLLGTGFFEESKVRDVVEHEYEHMVAAKKLGCWDFFYGVVLLDDEGVVNFSTFVGSKDFVNLSYADYKTINLAPKNLGDTDRIFE